jgi:hypothetical protein
MTESEAAIQIDRALTYVSHQSKTIAEAHIKLGVPLPELVAATVHRAFAIQAVDLNKESARPFISPAEDL